MNTEPRRAAIYCRISQDRTGAGLGVTRQQEDCERLAERLGWEVAQVFVDNDTSAYSGKPRPGYQAVLQAIKTGTVDAVLAWHEDRLHRAPRELEDYIDVCEPRSVPTHFARSGELDLTSASGRMTARILGAVARHESEHKSERTRRAQEQAVKAGKWTGGARPFGWRLLPDGAAEIEPAEALVVQQATSDVLAGMTLGGVIRGLNEAGVTTSTGGKWNYTSLRQVLSRPRNAGLAVWDGEVVGKTTWPVLVPEEQWRAVCAVLNDPNRRHPNTSNRARWLLSGIATCGAEGCGKPVGVAKIGSPKRGRRSRTIYRCRTGGGGHVYRDAETLNRYVTQVVVGVLAKTDWSSVDARQAEPDLVVQATTWRQRLDDAAADYAEGVISRSQLQTITKSLQGKIEDAERRMAAASGRTLLGVFAGKDVQAVWDGLDLHRQRAVVKELFEIRLLPQGKGGREFRPECVEIGVRDTPL